MGKAIITRRGGGINTKDVAPQITNLTCRGGNEKIDVAFTGVSAEYLPLVRFYRVVVRAGSLPTSHTDGRYLDIAPTTGGATMTAVLTGLTNDVLHHVRVYIRSPKGWQTSPDAKAVCTPRSIPALLNDASWEQIARASETDAIPPTWTVGSEKNIVLTTGEVLTLQIYGFKHDDLQSGGKAGITFGLKNLMAQKRQINATSTNVGGFTGSDMYKWLKGDLYNSLQTDLRAVVKMINKNTSAGNLSAKINTDGMKIFLFSEVESLGFIAKSYAGEGTVYNIFTGANAREYRSKYLGKEKYWWWTRSPSASFGGTFCSVTESGYAEQNITYAKKLSGVCFGFCV